MASKFVAGIIQLQVNSQTKDAKGEFTFNLGYPKRKTIVGNDKPHGAATEATIPFIEGKLTFSDTLDVVDVVTLRDADAVLTLENGKVISGKDMYYTGDADITTNEGEVPFRLECSEKLEVL